jgi:hypothetical protein
MNDIARIRQAQIEAGERAVIASLAPELRIDVIEQPADNVNHPSHYTAGKVECIDALEAATTGLGGIEAVCTANAIKYLWRWKQKNGHEDLRKARWYINRLLGEQA